MALRWVLVLTFAFGLFLSQFIFAVADHIVQDSKASDKDLVQELCNRTTNTTLCATAIKSDPRSNVTSDNRGFLRIILDHALPITTSTQSHIVDLLKNTTDNVTKECLHVCDELYDTAIYRLKSAIDLVYFKNRVDYEDLNTALGSFMGEFVDCEGTFAEPPSRPSPITDTDNYLANIGEIANEIVNLIECNRIEYCQGT